MRILHRQLAADLLRNALLFLGVIIAIFFVMALALMLGKSSVEGIPIWVIFRATWYEVVSNLNLIFPLTILSAAIFTYGRANSEGEFTALRVAGIHPWQVVVPAILIGSAGTLALATLQDEVMPAAHFAKRQELTREILDNLEEVLGGSRREISQARWCARWSDVVQDAEARLVLLDLLIINRDEEGNMVSRLHAREARPVFAEREQSLELTLSDVRRWDDDGNIVRAGELQVLLHLDALDVRAASSKRGGDRSYSELLSRGAQLELWAARAQPDLGRRLLRKSRRSFGLYHSRIAFSFSSVFFALLGATLGLWRPVGNRALVFLAGFLIVVGVYYPLQQWGQHLADDGSMPMGPTLWVGNFVLLLISGLFFRRIVRT